MKPIVFLLGLFVLPFTYVVHSADIADESDSYLGQFYDISVELLVDGEITSTPRMIVKVGERASIEVTSQNHEYRILVQTKPPQIESGVVVVPVSFDFKYEIEKESRAINSLVNLPIGKTVSLIGKTNTDAEVQLNASISTIAESPAWQSNF